jgi:hypothetical protein
MHSVEAKVGTPIWFARSMIAGCNSRPVAGCASIFSIIRGIVYQLADCKRQAAEHHDVDSLTTPG